MESLYHYLLIPHSIYFSDFINMKNRYFLVQSKLVIIVFINTVISLH